VVGHYQFDRINRPNCPSAGYPFDRIIQDLQTSSGNDDLIMEEIQRLQGELDQALGREKDLSEQLANCQALKFQVEDRLTREVAELRAKVAELEQSGGATGESDKVLREFAAALERVSKWNSQTP
jgi:hypothetical protein